MVDGGKIWMSTELAEGIRQQGMQTYPHECCEALLGRDRQEGMAPREILDFLPLKNEREDSPQNRFSINPRDVVDVDKAARARGLEVVGWYHSHPDHPARPSEYDREQAWPWYSYVIVSVEKGVPREMTSWRLQGDRGRYLQETIEIQSGARART